MRNFYFQKDNQINKGRVPWNKGKKSTSKNKGRPLSVKHREALRIPHKKSLVKRVMSEESRERLGKRMRDFYAGGGKAGFKMKKYINSGEKNHNWKGGVTSLNEKIRKSIEYRIWREAVFSRDNWTCVVCQKVGGDLHADHIKMFAFHPELRLAIDNGRTLCICCHKKTKTYMTKYHRCCPKV